MTEILREAGPEVTITLRFHLSDTSLTLGQGLHIDDISAQCGIDPSKLGVLNNPFSLLNPLRYSLSYRANYSISGHPSRLS